MEPLMEVPDGGNAIKEICIHVFLLHEVDVRKGIRS